ncbi:hypothetical protein ACFLQZ_03205 [Acidobacteriota bacterium]
MTKNGCKYFSDLSNGKLSLKPIEPILTHMKKVMKFKEVPKDLINKGAYGSKITEELTRLHLSIVRGRKSWKGLLVAFPGNRRDLRTSNVGTPYIRMILYPILDLLHRLNQYEKRNMPCVYLVGDRFSDVLLRKFNLLNQVVPNVIILTNDFYNNATNEVRFPDTKKNYDHEVWWQKQLCLLLDSEQGLNIPINENKCINARLLSHEVPASEGTEDHERLDILCYDTKDHSLIAFELKGPKCGKVEFENLFLQGMEHRNWLERNKMAVKFLYDGPGGRKIHSRKRVKLILGFCHEVVPSLFYKLREEAKRKDRYLDIHFCRYTVLNKTTGEIRLESV